MKDWLIVHRYVAFFDLDDTILATNSGRIMVEEARRNGLISRNVIVQGLFLALLYRIGLLDPHQIMKRMALWLKGIPEDRFIHFTSGIFKKRIKPLIRDKARDAIEYHKNLQGRTVILSAATNYVCQPVKEYLTMDDIICSHMELQHGHFAGRVKGAYCYGDEKLRRVLAYCEDLKFDPAEAYYYADSISDLDVLQRVGHPVCVSPDKRLREVAGQRGWEVAEW